MPKHCIEEDMEAMEVRLAACEADMHASSAHIERMSTSPSVTGVSVLGFTLPTKASLDTHLAAIHGKLNEFGVMAEAQGLMATA